MKLNNTAAWSALESHKQEVADLNLVALFEQDPQRFENFSLDAAGVFLDYSKNLLTPKTRELLLCLAEQQQLKDKIQALLSGEQVNNTERRQALHSALRAASSEYSHDVSAVLQKIESFVKGVHDGSSTGHTGVKFTDVVNIGIGGSDLGPVMVSEALQPYQLDGIQAHFVSNVDASDIATTLEKLDPATTLFVVASKTFTTQETLTNANTARN